MPIQTNLALEFDLHHVAIPGTTEDAARLNACWTKHPLKIGRIVAEHTPAGIVLQALAPLILVAVDEDYWREIGKLVALTGEPWWDFCVTAVDSEPQASHPHAHALSLYRITDKGEFRYLHFDDFDSFEEEAGGDV